MHQRLHTVSEFWTRHGFRETCVGDSGGPLMVKMNDRSFVIGIVSAGMAKEENGEKKSCTGSHPDVMGRVSAVRKWIDKTIVNFRSHHK